MAKRTRQGQKQCPACKKWIKGTRTRACPNAATTSRESNRRPQAPAPVEKTANTVTVEQVRAVAQTVKAIGGADRLNELLGLIKEVGGLKKFKDLLDAMSVPETTQSTF